MPERSGTNSGDEDPGSEPVASSVAMAALSDRLTEQRLVNGLVRTETVPVLEERMTVSKREVVTGKVRISTRTETHDEIAEIALDRNVVDVTRVAIGHAVDVPPKVRTEGDTTIVPIVEERLVVVKQLFLVEELHIRHQVEQAVARESVPLRRQHVTIEHLDADGRVLDPPEHNE